MWRRTKTPVGLLCALALLLVSLEARGDEPAGPAPTPPQKEVDPAIFEGAVKAYHARNFPAAAAGFWRYIRAGTIAVDKYESAQFLLAESLSHLGLWHAAANYYYQVAKTRSQPEIFPLSLARLEAMSRYMPFDEALIYKDLLYDSEFGSLPPVLFDWVNYVQGLFDYRNGYLDWAERHFDAIHASSAYAMRAQYVRAVYAIKNSRDDTGLKLLDQIVASAASDPQTKNDALLAQARLHFDRGQYQEAWDTYGQVKQIDFSYEQAQLMLEKAWTAFRLHDHRRAMGLLHALYAPSYAKFLLPDAFILRGLILKDLCHFLDVKGVVRNFRVAQGPAIVALHRRTPTDKIPLLVEGVREQGPLGAIAQVIASLQSERKLIQSYASVWEDVALDKNLRRLYDLELREQQRLWDDSFAKAADSVAETLLETEEQMSLLDYEAGLDIFRRVKSNRATQTVQEPLTVPYDSAKAYYEFDTEFWNDELHSYSYFVNNRCLETDIEP